MPCKTLDHPVSMLNCSSCPLDFFFFFFKKEKELGRIMVTVEITRSVIYRRFIRACSN